jgi:YVTN family beta-propeller protein
MRLLAVCGVLSAAFVLAEAIAADAAAGRAPCALVAAADGSRLYLAETLGRRVTVFDPATRKVTAEIPLPSEPSGAALAPDGSRLFVTSQAPTGVVYSVDPKAGKLAGQFPAGYGALAPVVTADGATLAVCNQFEDSVALFDAKGGKLKATVKVVRQPVAAAATKDGTKLFVANLLSAAASDTPPVNAVVSVIDIANAKVIATIDLPDGSNSLRGVAVSPDDSTVYVTHILARYHQPTTQLERGWMNTNALTVIDAKENKRLNTVLLDDVDRGAANPWAVTCTDKLVVTTQAGTHEVSLIDPVGLRKKIDEAAKRKPSATADDAGEGAPTADEVPDDLTFLRLLRRRIALPLNGPRAVAVVGGTVWSAGFFSDTLAALDIESGKAEAVKLGPDAPANVVRRGEMMFSDAALCFQSWQSCVSCHPDTRADSLNWDLLNDGLGNPKNTKNMIDAAKVVPVMSLGVRDTYKVAVRAGIRFIQFAVRPEEDADAIDAYLASLKPAPSPKLVGGKLSPAAKRGEALFNDRNVGCANCHSGPLHTDQQRYDLGLGTGLDKGKQFVTPRLTEVWRTGPWLHDGRANTMVDLLTKHNKGDQHGKTSQLKPDQIADLAEYVLSL